MFNQKIKELRIKNNLKQGELANKIGISQRVLSGLERGETQPTLRHIQLFSEFFNVSTDLLITGEDTALNSIERDIIEEVRKDKSLFDSLKAVLESKKRIEAMAA